MAEAVRVSPTQTQAMPKTISPNKRTYRGVELRKEREETNAYFAKLAMRLIGNDEQDRSLAWAELNSLRPLHLTCAEPPLAEDNTLDRTNPIHTINPNFLTAEDAWRGTCEIFPDKVVPLAADNWRFDTWRVNVPSDVAQDILDNVDRTLAYLNESMMFPMDDPVQ